MPGSNGRGLVLTGLDGSNPLGFLAAVGTTASLNDLNDLNDTPASSIHLGWLNTQEGWRPVIAGCGADKKKFCEAVLDSLEKAPMSAFDIGKDNKSHPSNKFPFACDAFVQKLREKQRRSSGDDRRDVDFLAGFGTDIYPNAKTGEFQDTSFRMVRSGDSKGQGLLFYAKANRKRTGRGDIARALFHSWDHHTVRSLLALGELHDRPLHRPSLHARGVEEVYGAERIHASQYYSNFAPAQPRM